MKFLVLLALLSFHALGSIVGVSTHPISNGENLLNTELVNNFSSSGSYGVQVRFLHQLSSKLNLDGAVRVLKNDLFSVMASGTYKLYPDYQNQPEISLKSFYEFENFSSFSTNHFGVAPIIGKGFLFWGIPAFPYASIPLGMRLNNDSSQSEFVSSLALGLSGRIPYQDLSNLIANFETNINLKNSTTNMALGVSLKFH